MLNLVATSERVLVFTDLAFAVADPLTSPILTPIKLLLLLGAEISFSNMVSLKFHG